jgi:hypothetical protein
VRTETHLARALRHGDWRLRGGADSGPCVFSRVEERMGEGQEKRKGEERMEGIKVEGRKGGESASVWGAISNGTAG